MLSDAEKIEFAKRLLDNAIKHMADLADKKLFEDQQFQTGHEAAVITASTKTSTVT